MQTVPVSRSSQRPQSKSSTLSFRCLVILDMLTFVPNTLRRVGESSSPVKTSENLCSPIPTCLMALKPFTRNTTGKLGSAIKRVRIKKTLWSDEEWFTRPSFLREGREKQSIRAGERSSTAEEDYFTRGTR